MVFHIVLLLYALVWEKKCYKKFVLAGCGGGRRECSVWEDKVFLDTNDSPGLFYVIYQWTLLEACVCTCVRACMCVRVHSHVCVCWLLILGRIRTRQAVYHWIVQIVPSTHVLKPLESNFLLSFSFFLGGGGRKSLFHPTACPSSSEVRAGIWRVISNLLFLGVALAVPELTL